MKNAETLGAMISAALDDFDKVAALASHGGIGHLVTVEITPRPHRPPKRLPIDMVAVYAFFHRGRALKIGKVGPNSGPRYTHHHYNPNSAPSNLARSLLKGRTRIEDFQADEATIGAWIIGQTDRVNLLLPAGVGLPLLSLLEAFLHVRWNPAFEGRITGT